MQSLLRMILSVVELFGNVKCFIIPYCPDEGFMFKKNPKHLTLANNSTINKIIIWRTFVLVFCLFSYLYIFMLLNLFPLFLCVRINKFIYSFVFFFFFFFFFFFATNISYLYMLYFSWSPILQEWWFSIEKGKLTLN